MGSQHSSSGCLSRCSAHDGSKPQMGCSLGQRLSTPAGGGDSCRPDDRGGKRRRPGNSNAQQNVEFQEVNNERIIRIQPADPEVIYVPECNSDVVYGAVEGRASGVNAISSGAGVALRAF